MEKKFDAYQMVTDRVCAMLEKGIKPWSRPWSTTQSYAWSGNDGRVYSLLNQILLADPEKDYKTIEELEADVAGEWLTYAQAQERGGQVRKGEKGRKIVFFKVYDKHITETDENGNEVEKINHFPVLRAYTVFHIRQCDGLCQKYHTDGDKLFDFSDDVTAESVAKAYIKREGITYNQIKGNRAYYSPELDLVVTPLKAQFERQEQYYATLFHELTHSTGHESRLNRINKQAAFGADDYSTEELVAEIGSASILATLGLETDTSFNNSTAYIKNWLNALKKDKKMIVVAAARAEKAIRLILGID